MITGPDVVPMVPDHVESFHRALDVVARERKYLTFSEAPSLEQTRAFVLNSLKRGDPRFVALDRGEVVGWCDIGRHFFAAHAHRGSLAIGVVPDYRRRGLGQRLLEANLNQAKRLGFVRIELEVHADNAAAIALYERFGFRREGVLQGAVLIDGAYRDALKMAIVHRRGPEESTARPLDASCDLRPAP